MHMRVSPLPLQVLLMMHPNCMRLRASPPLRPGGPCWLPGEGLWTLIMQVCRGFGACCFQLTEQQIWLSLTDWTHKHNQTLQLEGLQLLILCVETCSPP